MLKNKSHFKKSYGDEAGRAPKKGIITSTNTGKVYFTSWSMDVKIEGLNVVRHLDLTTHNHNPSPGNSRDLAAHLEDEGGLQAGRQVCRHGAPAPAALQQGVP